MNKKNNFFSLSVLSFSGFLSVLEYLYVKRDLEELFLLFLSLFGGVCRETV